jgi:CHAT domain-containing protein
LQPKTQGVIEKLSSVKPALPTLYELQQAVAAAGIPVLLFWVTHTNVIAWVISPEDLEVKAVFLPEVAVIDKVKKITTSIRNKKFDNTSARELHTYLIKPFSKQFTRKQILVIPQGPLLSLPFEVLIDPETGRFLAEDVAVSYAPNAAFALRVLKNPLPAVSKILAVYDEHIENQTKEISRIAKLSYLQINAREASNLTESEVSNLLGQAENVHVLFHGEYNSEDPLQSTITLSSNPMSSLNREGRTITAAELLAIDWRDTDLAVFSSCEGAVVQTRISNEMFGISWALLAGGVDHVVLSRWRVNAQSNADWMETFYMFFASGSASPALAVAEAMRTMIKSGQRDPFYWAGPQVFGR